MPVSRILLAAVLALCISGCRSETAEEAAARELMDGRPFYDRGKGTPAEYMTNLRGQYNAYAAVLRGEDLYPAAVETLARLRNEARLGFDWQHPVPEARIPKLRRPPEIDGEIDELEWAGAMQWRGEYLLSGTEPSVQEHPSRWYAAWDDACFYFAADFTDADVVSYSEPEKRIFLGDSLELFIRPCEHERLYYEFIVNPAGELWMHKQAFSRWGGFIAVDERIAPEVRFGAKVRPGGYSVELAVPFDLLHSRWCRRKAAAGDKFRFMAVRTNLDGGMYSKHAPVPFLYDGHNVFGYFKAELTDSQF